VNITAQEVINKFNYIYNFNSCKLLTLVIACFALTHCEANKMLRKPGAIEPFNE